MSRNVLSYSQDKTHPVVIELNGLQSPGGMAVGVCCGQTVTCGLYPIPYGTGLEIAVGVPGGRIHCVYGLCIILCPKTRAGRFFIQ